MAQGSLWSQPASFWLGAFLVAEVPVALAGALLGEALRARILAFVVSGPFGLLCAALFTLGCGLAVAWVGHRLGLGE